MACRVISLAWGEVVAVSRQAHARGTPRSLSGTYQKHSLFVDEGLLQSQRGGIQTWDWGKPGQRAWIPRCRSRG